MPERYKSIGLPESKYKVISRAKADFEADANQRVDWGEFLRILALAYLIAKGLEALGDQNRNGHRTR